MGKFMSIFNLLQKIVVGNTHLACDQSVGMASIGCTLRYSKARTEVSVPAMSTFLVDARIEGAQTDAQVWPELEIAIDPPRGAYLNYATVECLQELQKKLGCDRIYAFALGLGKARYIASFDRKETP